MTKPLPPAPVPPEDWECCGSECGEACIFEIYRRDKAAYEAALANSRLPETAVSPDLSVAEV